MDKEQQIDAPRFITPEQIATDLQVSRATGYRLAATIPNVLRLGGSIRIERSDYETWLQDKKRAGGGR